MPARDKKPQLEVPEDAFLEDLVDENQDQDDDQPVLPRTKPDTVSEADWADQQVDVPFDDEDEYS